MHDADRLSNLLERDAALIQTAPGIFSRSGRESTGNEYDSAFGAIYETIACSALYNRLIWGYPTAEFGRFCREALSGSRGGWVLDAGCGSLAFSADVLAGTQRPVVFLDQSQTMLQRARSRVMHITGEHPSGKLFFRGDVMHLPFKPASFETVISLNLLHVCPAIAGALGELKRVLKQGGLMALTTLIENHRYGDAYLRRLGRMGYIIPRTERELSSAFREAGLSAEYRLIGNMAFIRCR